MKDQNLTVYRLIVASFLGFSASGAFAWDIAPSWYVHTDAGVNLLQDITVPGTSDKVSSDAGVRWSLAGGYGFQLAPHWNLGVELETGVLYNSLSSVSAGGTKTSLGGDFVQVPLLGNLVLNYHAGRWSPYIGVGGGADVSSITINSVGSAPVSSIGSETDPAFQAMAGLNYQLSEHSELGLGYKYMASFPNGLNALVNHSVVAAYTLHF